MADVDRIIFQGLCCFMNVGNDNPTMGKSSVIAVRADGHGHAHAGQADDHFHVAYIAFDASKASVDDHAGFSTVPQAIRFEMLALNELNGVKGLEVLIDGNPAATPTVNPSYDELVASKDEYWPDAKDKWNSDFVPAGGGKPKASRVAFYMPFGLGTIESGAQQDREWAFRIKGGVKNGEEYKGKFAREVHYSDFPHSGNGITVIFNSLDTGAEVKRLTFTPRVGFTRVTLMVGSNTPNDLDSAMFRHNTKAKMKPEQTVVRAEHFAMLNQVADPALGAGPIPEAVGGVEPGPLDGPGGGFQDGFCGPVKP
jgi:hypothetical protein